MTTLDEQIDAANIEIMEIKESAWISIGDSKPSFGVPVLVNTEIGVFIDEWDYYQERPVSFSSETIVTGEGWQENDVEDVTHWMPIPSIGDDE